MDEKKLTDEEIVKALENCLNGDYKTKCKSCHYDESETLCQDMDRAVLDLIHHQKAEIERLTIENERIAWSKQEYLDWVHGFLSTHTDMKDRGEDYKMFDRDWMCGVFWAKIEGSIEYIIDLENQRNELQNQVETLKEENAQLSEMSDYDKGHKEGYEHGARTTAKEIYDWSKDFFTWDEEGFVRELKDFVEHYGVEVE